jgi:hypothetical protein
VVAEQLAYLRTSLRQAPPVVHSAEVLNERAIRTRLTPLLEKYGFDYKRVDAEASASEKRFAGEPPREVAKAQEAPRPLPEPGLRLRRLAAAGRRHLQEERGVKGLLQGRGCAGRRLRHGRLLGLRSRSVSDVRDLRQLRRRTQGRRRDGAFGDRRRRQE